VRDVPTLGDEIALVRACLAREIPIVGIGLGAQVLAIAAGGGSEIAPLAFTVALARRTRDDALCGYLPQRFPVVAYGRDRALVPANAVVLAQDERGAPALWQIGRSAFGFEGHPGVKIAMIEDLVMEFEESAPDIDVGLGKLRAVARDVEDALVPIMTGLVQATRWMDAPASPETA
jgi:GMP synthase-like glutamine amidotransferase